MSALPDRMLSTPTEVLSQWMKTSFRDAFADSGVDFAASGVTPTTNPEFGDYQCNDAMAAGKKLKKAPRDVAQAVIAKAGSHEAVESITIAGPGFLNIRLSANWLISRLYAMEADPFLGVPARGAGQTVVLDYSSPNVAKPMHIGHIRSTIIGNALDRLHRFLGYRVIADNHLGDWGTQFGILIRGYREFANLEALKEDAISELERIYVQSYSRTQTDETWMNACRQELVKLQAGDPENLALWKQFIDMSMVEFDKIYRRLGVSFDLVRGESFYNDRLPGVMAALERHGLSSISEGATVVRLDEEKLPLCIVRKTDGGFNYATTDIATVMSRVEEFAPSKIVYVTDERQQLHFRQFFTIARKLGHAVQFDHVWFGLMRLPEGTFSTRQGNVIKLERLLDEAESRALKIIQESSPETPPERQREIARAVGIGAVKYADLSQTPQTAVVFTWDKALALDGNSGPYLQYAHARIASVHDKYAERHPGVDLAQFPIQFTEPVERALAAQVIRFPDVVLSAAQNYRPNYIADYLYDLAQLYSTFYQNVPFLKAPEGIRESRVRLCGLVARVLGKGLDLLGIEAPDRI